MKVTTTLDVEPLPKDRLLAFYRAVGTATLDGHTFDITCSPSGLGLGLYEEVDGITEVHTVNLNPAVQAALEAIIGAPVQEPPMGSVVLVYGPTGTAHQRHHRDGLWHDTAGRSYTWENLLRLDRSGRQPLVVHAPADES